MTWGRSRATRQQHDSWRAFQVVLTSLSTTIHLKPAIVSTLCCLARKARLKSSCHCKVLEHRAAVNPTDELSFDEWCWRLSSSTHRIGTPTTRPKRVIHCP